MNLLPNTPGSSSSALASPGRRRIFRQLRTTPIIVIGVVWFIINAFCLWKNGIVTTGEAEKYIYQAQLYADTGHLGSPNFWLYYIPIFLLSLCLKWHLSFAWIVGLQLLLNLLSTVVFYRTAALCLRSQHIALAGAILLLLNLPYHTFNTFLQTESIFQSLTLLFSCYLIRLQKITAASLATIFVALVLLTLTRPNGLLYWPATLVFLFFSLLSKAHPIRKLAFGGVALFLFIFLLNTAMGSGGELDFMLPFLKEHIICGVPTLSQPAPIHTTGNGNSAYALLFYITHNMGQFIRLGALRSIAFWGVYRSYYSPLHNGFLMAYFYAITLAALLSVRWWRRNYPLSFLCLLMPVLLSWVMVILTCDDWSNRIYLGISPFLLLLGLPVLLRFSGNKKIIS
jgi:hypothetical protein